MFETRKIFNGEVEKKSEAWYGKDVISNFSYQTNFFLLTVNTYVRGYWDKNNVFDPIDALRESTQWLCFKKLEQS